MARLRIRAKTRQTLPGGRYTWQIDFNRYQRSLHRCRSNADAVKPILELMDGTAAGKYRIDYGRNWKGEAIAITMYLTHKSDVALVKMCYADAIRNIYELKLETPNDAE